MADKKPLAKLRWQSYAEFMVERANIRKFCKAVAKQFRPRKIILFGSYAYGRPTEDSDVDLLVVMNRTRPRGERMSFRIREAVDAGFPMDLLVRTPGFIAKRLKWKDCFTQEIMRKGKVLYEAPDA
jgi:predicted nucleotidyltransferase